MPIPIDYVGTQDDDQTRAIDVVHIEPSIREGTFLVSSLYGHDAAAPLYRFPPVNTAIPFITGSPVIPAVLTCEEGRWESSPSPQFAYQWMANGVDIPGATNRTWTTTADYDGTYITCEVRGFNTLGEGYAVSDPLGISLIEPQEIRDEDFAVVTGNAAYSFETIQNMKQVVTTGIGALDRYDVNRSVAYYLTGRSADQRHDVNVMLNFGLSGLEIEDTLLMWDHGPAVINWDTGAPLVDGVPQPMHLKNPEAEMGHMGWTTFGNVRFTTYNSPVDQYKGEYFWMGGLNSNSQNIPYSYQSQDVEVWPIWFPDVDLGDCWVIAEWQQNSHAGADQANIKFEFLDANKNTLSSNAGPGLLGSKREYWLPRRAEAPIPANCRYVRVIIEYYLQAGEDNNGYVDDVALLINKGTILEPRDKGPGFEQWRLKFTQTAAAEWIALSELRFNDALGGTDLTEGGEVLFGSNGPGGQPENVFDNAHTPDYWRSAEGAVNQGRAWLGYDFGTEVRPREIDITARENQNSFQMAQAMMLQASNDGTYWVDIQEYDNIPLFQDSERRTFEILPSGSRGIWEVESRALDQTFGSAQWVVHPVLGSIFQAKVRMNIDSIRAFLRDTGTYRLWISKVTFHNANGMLWNPVGSPSDHVIEDLTGVSGMWVSDVLAEPLELEVGEYFLIASETIVRPTSTLVDPLFWRTGEYGPAAANNEVYREIKGFAGDAEQLVHQGTGNYSNIYQNRFYAVDFTVSIF